MVKIKISRDFSTTPGARYRSDGVFSGEEFRERFLEPLFEDAGDKRKVEICFDDVIGYSVGFLEEVFGGLVRKFGYNICMLRLWFLSCDDPGLIDEIDWLMEEADNV